MLDLIVPFILFMVTVLTTAALCVFIFAFALKGHLDEKTETRTLELHADELFTDLGISSDTHSR